MPPIKLKSRRVMMVSANLLIENLINLKIGRTKARLSGMPSRDFQSSPILGRTSPWTTYQSRANPMRFEKINEIIGTFPSQKVHKELQYKFNIFLGLNVVLCLITCWMSYTYDIWQKKDYMLPESYLNRHKINAKLRAEEEAAAKEGMSSE